MNQKKRKIVIAGGGTGGHIYPALGIARSLKDIDPEIDIEFVGTSEGMETKIIPKEGFKLHLVQGGKLNLSGRWLEKLKTLVKLPMGFIESIFYLLEKKPDYVLGVGGYASGPFVLAASLLGVKTGIWEPNAQPGLANRWLSHFVGDCFLVFEEAKEKLSAKKYYIEGMPVRKEIEQASVAISAQESKKLNPDSNSASGELKVLCFGGSQGSRVINNALISVIQNLTEASTSSLSKFHLVHQIGSTDWNQFSKKYSELKSKDGLILEPKEFIFDMAKYYQWADLVICRGGASTLAEVAAFGIPPIVIPLPAADDHQVKNAQVLQAAGAAVLLPQNELSPDRLKSEIEKLFLDIKKRSEMKLALKNFFRANASKNIAQIMLKSIS